MKPQKGGFIKCLVFGLKLRKVPPFFEALNTKYQTLNSLIDRYFDLFRGCNDWHEKEKIHRTFCLQSGRNGSKA